MDKLVRYRELVQKVITDYANFGSPRGDIERELIFDTQRDRYLLLNIGWDDQRRVYGCVLHFDIKDCKIWLQYNGTEIDFAEELVQLGVAKQDIVLGFHSPFMRKFTDYAVV